MNARAEPTQLAVAKPCFGDVALTAPQLPGGTPPRNRTTSQRTIPPPQYRASCEADQPPLGPSSTASTPVTGPLAAARGLPKHTRVRWSRPAPRCGGSRPTAHQQVARPHRGSPSQDHAGLYSPGEASARRPPNGDQSMPRSAPLARRSACYASALALMASNSAWEIVPVSRSALAFSISCAAPPLAAVVRTYSSNCCWLACTSCIRRWAMPS